MSTNAAPSMHELQDPNSPRWGTLLKECTPIVSAMVRRRGGNDYDVKEILQSALIAVFEKVRSGEYREEGKLPNYFVRIARFQWLKKIRDEKSLRQQSSLDDVAPFVEENLRASADEHRDRERHEGRKDAVLRGLNRLDDECRDLLERHYLEGDSTGALAEDYELKPGTLRKRMHACRTKLRKLLEGGDDFDTLPA